MSDGEIKLGDVVRLGTTTDEYRVVDRLRDKFRIQPIREDGALSATWRRESELRKINLVIGDHVLIRETISDTLKGLSAVIEIERDEPPPVFVKVRINHPGHELHGRTFWVLKEGLERIKPPSEYAGWWTADTANYSANVTMKKEESRMSKPVNYSREKIINSLSEIRDLERKIIDLKEQKNKIIRNMLRDQVIAALDTGRYVDPDGDEHDVSEENGYDPQTAMIEISDYYKTPFVGTEILEDIDRELLRLSHIDDEVLYLDSQEWSQYEWWINAKDAMREEIDVLTEWVGDHSRQG